MRRIGVEERRARLAVRHHLAPRRKVTSVAEAARGVVGLHSSDPATVYLSAWARMKKATVADIERELYDERSVVRMLGMRRTMFVVPTDAVGIVDVSSTRAIAARERTRLVRLIEEQGIAKDGERWMRKVEKATLAALIARGSAVASELAKDVPELRQPLQLGAGSKWETVQQISSRVVLVLAAQRLMIRGKPRGTWISSQYRWHPTDAWLPAGIDDLSTDDARVELVRRWLAAFGPGTVTDITWWTGWTLGATRKALAAIDTEEVDLDGVPGVVLADDVAPVRSPGPWVALLPGLDPTPMGWKERDWYVGPHAAAVFDRSGNIGPTVWSDGRVVGAWAQRKDGEVAYRLLEDVGAGAASAIEKAAGQLQDWFGDVRVTTRFPSPLERELKL